MIKWVSQGLDMGTVDQNQQGIANRGVTAREVVIANENALKLKGLFDLFLTDLWVQKTKLRIINILTNYTEPRTDEITGKESYQTFFVENGRFPLGDTGNLNIKIIGENEEMPLPTDLQEESKMIEKKSGKKTQTVAMPVEYLDNFDYDVQVLPDSLFKKDTSEAMIFLEDKLAKMATYFPQEFMANRAILFKDFVRTYGDSEDKYKSTEEQPEQQEPTSEQMIPNLTTGQNASNVPVA